MSADQVLVAVRPAELRIALASLPGMGPGGLNVETTEDWLHAVAMSRSPDGLVRGYATRWDEERGASGGTIWQTPDTRCWVTAADSSTRDRLLRYVAKRVGRDTAGRCPWWWPLRTGPRWGLGYGDQAQWDDFGIGAWYEVPTLADLDPGCPTLLEDGARLVDAVALVRVAVHLGSRP